MSDATPILPGLSPVEGLEIHARFDGGALSSNGGALLLREVERRMGLADVLASCLTDQRDPGRVQHSYTSMIRARMIAIACGDEDCDDHDTLTGAAIAANEPRQPTPTPTKIPATSTLGIAGKSSA